MKPSQLSILDSSIIVKWFRQEEVLAEQALRLRQACLVGQLHVATPELMIYEVGNALRYKAELSTKEVVEAVQSLFSFPLEIIPLSPKLAGRAIEIARAYDETVYDATFIALAESLGADFITADEKLAQRLGSSLPFVRFLGQVAL